MERLYREANHTMFRAQRILELNPEHALIKLMCAMSQEQNLEPRLNSYFELLYNSALLIENEKLENPVALAERMADLMVAAQTAGGGN